MAGTEVKVTISATDNASSILKKVGASATAMAKDLTAAGKAGEKALDGFDDDAAKAGTALAKVGQEATKAGTALQKAGQQTAAAGRDWDQFEKNAIKAGAAIGTVAGLLAKAGQASVNETNSIRALRAAYGDSADELIRFADSIQQTTIYSNDAARASVLFAQSLAQNYNLSTAQIQELVARSADLAAVNGIDLYDAITRTSGAIRGEGEAAERLGLNMSDSAVAAAAAAAGLTGWNTTMTESEKAAFRFTVFLEQSNYALGQAAAQADTTAGKTRQLVNEFQDFGTTLGKLSGPAGEVLSVFGNIALAGPLMGAGIGKAVAQLAKFRAGSALASAALGPYGLAIAGVALGVGLLMKSHRDAEAAIKAYDEAVQNAAKTLFDLKDQGAGQELLADAQATGQGLALALGTGVKAYEQLFEAQSRAASQGQIGLGVSQAQAEAIQAESRALDEQIAALDKSALTTKQSIAAQEDWNTILDTSGANLGNNVAAVDALTKAYLNNEISGEQFVASIDKIAQDAAHYGETLLELAGSFEQYTKYENERAANSVRSSLLASTAHKNEVRSYTEFENVRAAASLKSSRLAAQARQAELKTYTEYENTRAEQSLRTSRAIARATQDELQTYTDYETTRATLGQRDAANHERRRQQLLEEADLNRRLAAEQDNLASGLHDYEGDLEQVTAFTESQTQAQQALADSYASAAGIVTTLDGTYQGLSAALGIVANDFLDVATAMSGVRDGTGALDMADALNDTAQALDGVLATFQTIDALGQRMSSAESIAEKLIGQPGEWAEIDDLLQRSRISQETYTSAVAAGYTILESAGDAETALNVIRAQQLPLLADATAAYEDQLEAISEMAPAQQTLALAYLDSATQAKASELASLALSASMGELGENGQRVATNIIAAGAAADPVLKSLLTDMGLIEEGADGEIKVNFPDADATTQAIDNLRMAIDSLNVTLGGTPPKYELATDVTGPLADHIKGGGVGKGAKGGGLFDIQDQSATYTINSSVTGPLAADITGMGGVGGGVGKGTKGGGLFSIEDQSATVTIDTQQTGASIPALKTDIEVLDGTAATVTLAVEDQASIPIDSIAMRAHAYGGSIHTAGLKADSTSAEETIAATTASGEGYASNIFVSTLDGNPEPFYGNVGAAIGVGDSFAATTFTATADGDPGPFYGSIGAAEGVGNSFAGSVYTASVDGDTSPFYNAVGGINGSVVGTAYINVVERRIGGNVAFIAHGGAIWADMPARSPDRTVPGAAHGRAGAGRTVMVGEYGRELVTLPTGSFVTPHPATESRVRESSRGGRGDGGIRIQTLNLYPATPDVRGAIEARTRTAYRTG